MTERLGDDDARCPGDSCPARGGCERYTRPTSGGLVWICRFCDTRRDDETTCEYFISNAEDEVGA